MTSCSEREKSGGRGPLSSYRVLELGSTVAGPFCGRLFADFGAEVIKVEMPEGDPVRTMGSVEGSASLYAASIFRNKSLIAVDMRTAHGQDIVRRLAEKCDVVIENFRPGTLEKWALGYEDLRAVNPGIVMVRISGFGQTGPYSARPGYGVIGEAMSGLRNLTGDPDRPPARMNTSLGDYVAGLYAAFGAMVALDARGRSGKGQVVDAALYECAFSFMEPHVPAYNRLGVIAQRTGSELPGSVPNNLYTSKEGRHIHITAMADSVFKRLCHAMGRPELAAEGMYKAAKARVLDAAEVDRHIQTWVGAHALEEVEAALVEADVPATRIFTIADVFADPHFRAREMLASVPSSELRANVTVANVVPKLSDTPGNIRHAGHRVGEDTRQVLAQWLDLHDDEIDNLIRDCAVMAA
ncbi:CaiB/BaiF CoA transferase family protein [Variovorax sp. PBL-E5]|uniref:CaiB/BaiF CoA transferase family protein n=1 Tax=Variovorax sp. PBL-E5 TaxID=434014 RepID=UPI0013193974|nr:CoA transferase [Variovorax sp. PBL-E5]VTU45709.1 Succinyl-CoA:(R)-benzylsuccinate CoA-transferase subunit BbsF [Variovorax sp. PBL-E5]